MIFGTRVGALLGSRVAQHGMPKKAVIPVLASLDFSKQLVANKPFYFITTLGGCSSTLGKVVSCPCAVALVGVESKIKEGETIYNLFIPLLLLCKLKDPVADYNGDILNPFFRASKIKKKKKKKDSNHRDE